MALFAVTRDRSLRRFAIVGLTGCVLQFALFALLADGLGWDHRVAAMLATAVGLAENFVLHRVWSFEASAGAAGAQAWRFVVVSAVAIGVNVLALTVLVDILGMAEVPGEALAVCFQAPVSYIGNRVWTFAA